MLSVDRGYGSAVNSPAKSRAEPQQQTLFCPAWGKFQSLEAQFQQKSERFVFYRLLVYGMIHIASNSSQWRQVKVDKKHLTHSAVDSKKVKVNTVL